MKDKIIRLAKANPAALTLLVKVYTIAFISIFLYLNPLHWPVSSYVIISIIWLLCVYFFKLSYKLSFLLGLLFLVLAALATAFGHPGYAEKFAPYTFWFFTIGALQKVFQAFQLRPQKEERGAQSTAKGRQLSKRDGLLILLLLLPVLLLYRSWFSIVPLASGDWIYKFPENLQFHAPVSWNTENLGTFYIPFLWTYPLQVVETLLAQLFRFNFALVEKIVWFLPTLFLSILSTTVFIRTFGGKLIALVFGAIFFLANTYTILLFAGGQMLFALGFALFPLVFALAELAIRFNKLSLKILAGLGVALLGFADPRIAFLFVLTVSLYTIFRFLSDDLNQMRHVFAKYLTLLFMLYTIPFALHFYWVLPTFLTNARFNIGSLIPDSKSLNFSFMTLNNVFTVFQPHWPENIFGKTHYTQTMFFIFPLLFYATPFLLRRPVAWFFVILSLCSAFLTKGTNAPLGEVYSYLLRVLPGFELFRDPSKFYVPLVLSYTLLFGLVIEQIYWRLRDVPLAVSTDIKRIIPWTFLLSVALLLYGLALPAYLREMDGTLESKKIDQSYQTYYAETTQKVKGYYRSLWIPEKSKFAYQSDSYPIVNGVVLAQKEPFNELIKNPFHTFTYLDDQATIEFLRMLNIRFLNIRNPSELRFNNQKDKYEAGIAHMQLMNDLSKRDGLKKVNLFKDTDTFEVVNPMPKFYAADKIFWVYGSSKVYSTVKTLPEVSLMGNAFIRRETLPDIPLAHKDMWQAQIIESNFATASGVLTFDMPRFERVLYIFNTELPAKVTQLRFRIEGLHGKQFAFLARWFTDATEDKEQVYGRNRHYVWEPTTVTKIEGTVDEYVLTLPFIPKGFENGMVDRVIAYPLDQIPSLIGLFNDRRVLPIVETLDSTSTHYTISVREATLPYVLLFSESYNTGWQAKINDERFITQPVFNLMNGFIIPISGNYMVDVFFTPQPIVMPFFFFSVLVFLVVLVCFVVALERDYRLTRFSKKFLMGTFSWYPHLGSRQKSP